MERDTMDVGGFATVGVVLLLVRAAMPASAMGDADPVDECQNAEKGPSEIPDHLDPLVASSAGWRAFSGNGGNSACPELRERSLRGRALLMACRPPLEVVFGLWYITEILRR